MPLNTDIIRGINFQPFLRFMAYILSHVLIGAVCWQGAAMKENITYLKEKNVDLQKLREQDQAAHKIIDCSKAETVATCVAAGGTDCAKQAQ